MSMASKNGVRERVARYRVSMRESGLRPIQIWVPDTRRSGFAAECRRQCLNIRKHPSEQKTLQWLRKAADTEGWQ